MNVSKLMKRAVPVCRPDDPLDRAAARMRATGIDALPVVDNAGRLVGLLRRSLVPDDGDDASDTTVETAMQRRVSVCRPTDSLSDLDATINTLDVDCVPVVDSDGVLCGLVFAGDVWWLSRTSLRS